MKRALITAVLLCSAPLLADSSLPPSPYANVQLEGPAQEAKAAALMGSLRCLQCQGQSIADSDAQIAGDLRNQVRLRIKAGEDPEAIRAWLIDKYGDYVSYAPRVTGLTWPLFAAPLALLCLAVLLLRRRFTRSAA
jgi:cytochrome c-type biogenesis protein CcmH/NrfF